MTFRNPHLECGEKGCQTRSCYMRYFRTWIKVGEFHSVCKKFDLKYKVWQKVSSRDIERQEYFEDVDRMLENLIKKYQK